MFEWPSVVLAVPLDNMDLAWKKYLGLLLYFILFLLKSTTVINVYLVTISK